jgi:hypothetical protein
MSFVETVKNNALSWPENDRYKQEGCGRWPYHTPMVRPYALQASGIAIGLLNRFGRLESVGPDEKREAAELIRNCQDPSARYFKDLLEIEDTHDGRHSWEKIWNQRSNAAGVLPLLAQNRATPRPREGSSASIRNT